MAELTQAQLDSLQFGSQPVRTLSQAQMDSLGIPAGGSSVNQAAVQDFQSRFGALARGGAQGASLNTSDELTGVLSALGAMRRGVNPAEAYTGARDAARGANQAAQEAYPLPYGGGQLMGGAATAFASAPAAVGKTARGTFGRMLGIGATEGAIAGGGASDGGNLPMDTLIGAGIGAGVGAVAHPMASIIRALGRTAANPVRGMMGESPTIANRAVARSMDRASMDQQELLRVLRQSQDDGQDMFTIADALGNSGQRTLSGVARQPGPGRQEIVDFLNSRQQGQSERVSSFVADALDAQDTAAQRVGSLQAQRTADADVNYSAARDGAGAVDVSGALGVINQRRALPDGTNLAGDGIDGRLASYGNRLATGENTLIDFNRVLGIKQDLNDDIGAAVRAGRNNEARELGALQRELDRALEAASPNYRAANDTFAAQSRVIDAVDQGQNAARPSIRATDNIDQFGAMNPDQQGAFRTGYGDARLTAIERSPEGVNVARPFTSPKVSAEMDAFALEPELFNRKIGRENTMFETRRQAIGGSQTADNMADNQDVGDIDVGMITNILAGRWGAAGGQAMQRVANATQGTNEDTRAAIARILLSNDPQTALAPVLRRSMQDQTQQAILSALLRRPATQGAIESLQ